MFGHEDITGVASVYVWWAVCVRGWVLGDVGVCVGVWARGIGVVWSVGVDHDEGGAVAVIW